VPAANGNAASRTATQEKLDSLHQRLNRLTAPSEEAEYFAVLEEIKVVQKGQ
jgi:hypothetical protein